MLDGSKLIDGAELGASESSVGAELVDGAELVEGTKLGTSDSAVGTELIDGAGLVEGAELVDGTKLGASESSVEPSLSMVRHWGRLKAQHSVETMDSPRQTVKLTEKCLVVGRVTSRETGLALYFDSVETTWSV